MTPPSNRPDEARVARESRVKVGDFMVEEGERKLLTQVQRLSVGLYWVARA